MDTAARRRFLSLRQRQVARQQSDSSDREPLRSPELQERNYAVLHEILEDAAKHKDAPKGSALQLVGDFYASAMDSAQAEALGAKPLDAEMGKIAAIKTTADLEDELARLQTMGVRVPLVIGAGQDAKSSTDVVIQIGQSGLSLPDREYYLKQDDGSKKLRDQYVAHVTKMFCCCESRSTRRASADGAHDRDSALDGLDEPHPAPRPRRHVPQGAVRLALGDGARHSVGSVPDQYGHRRPASGDRRHARFHEGGRRDDDVGLDCRLADVPALALGQRSAEWLSSAFVNEQFDFGGRVLNGTTEMRPRWKRAMQLVDGSVGEALGQLYVAKTFTPEAKARAKKMVDNLRAELRERLSNLEWMSAATRQQAVKKLDAFQVKIGYPDSWRDYSKLTVDRGPVILNALRTRQFEYNRNIAKLGKPVDRTESGMTPPTVNAYYNPRMNEIVFPAGILQPPFFDANADDAVNYGGIGAVIGHEMTHGFDDQGRKFDADGTRPAADDAAKYITRSTMVQKQYDAYVAIDTMHVNGKLTLGENTADLGGLNVAYGALQKALKGKPHDKIDGFTPEQRFFLSFAQIWRNNARPEAVRLRINTDPHSPGQFRCNGPISNMPEFEAAFGLKDSDPMMRPPTDRAKLW